MPPSTITTSGTQSPLVASSLGFGSASLSDPTTYLPYRSPQILTSSGTWRHPKPGFPISIAVTIIGGGGGGGGFYNNGVNHAGGGGGAGRINDILALTVTSDVAVIIGAAGAAAVSAGNGGTGGQSSFGTNTAAGGIGGAGGGNATHTNGGAGSVGGGGGYTYQGGDNSAANGGTGDTYVGGGGGFSTGSAAVGTSAVAFQTPQLISTAGPSGLPNGSTGAAKPGTGGLLSNWRPELLYYGDGSYGANANISAGAGKQGAIFIWYNRP